MVPITLSQTHPDFESILLQMQLYLQAKDSWKDMLTSSTGETLLETVAAAATFNQYAIESAVREAYLTTARRSSSIYALTRTLGVRITRKAPASIPAELIRPSAGSALPLLIPALTQFDVGGSPFFCRTSLSFAAGATSATVVLYEGEVKQQTFAADSTAFREIILNELNFAVSDEDVIVQVVNPATNVSTTWSRTNDGIWSLGSADNSYYDATSGDGDVVLAFGDGYHGALPSVGHNIVVRYATTSGSEGNANLAGQQVACTASGYTFITGTTTGAATGGADEKPASYYKTLAPKMYRARSRAVVADDYSAIAQDYPSAAAAVVKAQRDIAPNDLRWMNVVRICVLPSSGYTFSDSQWEDFLLYFKKYSHAAIHLQPWNPTRLVADLQFTAALKATAIPENVLPELEAAVRALFARDYDTLGKRISLFDIHTACSQVEGVDYIVLALPQSDLVPPDDYTWYDLGTLNISLRYSERVTS